MNTAPNTGKGKDGLSRDDRFDVAMRALHRDALAHVSPQARWKLRPAKITRPSGTDRARKARVGAALAGAAAAVFALALGVSVSLWNPGDDAGRAAGTLAAASQEEGATVLEQDPDFYAWLASDDADLLAME